MFCGRLLADGESGVCNRCRLGLPVFSGELPNVRFTSAVCAPFLYEDMVRDSLLRFKFRGMSQYAEVYGPLLAASVGAHLADRFDVISWVPVSRKRRRTRGYDQAYLLAEAAAKSLGGKPEATLRKRRDNPAQSSRTSAESRRANVVGVYEAAAPERLAGKRILLIDDILTTGATLSEAARTLRTAGAADVVGAAFAAAGKEG